MRIILVLALILAIVAVASAQQNRVTRRCQFCKRMMGFLGKNQHRRFFWRIFSRRWFCKGCDAVQNEDKCSPNPCMNDGECKPEDGSCACSAGFTGTTCEVEDKCSPNPCKNDGECQPEDGSCVCLPENSGPTCEEKAPCTSFDPAAPPRNCATDCFGGTEYDLYCSGVNLCCGIPPS